MNQDQLADGGLGLANAADLSSFTRIVVGISGAAGLTLRLQFGLPPDDGGTMPQYCTPMPTTLGTGDAGIPLSSLTESCWAPGGATFDPATLRPLYVGVAVLTDVDAAHPFPSVGRQVAGWSSAVPKAQSPTFEPDAGTGARPAFPRRASCLIVVAYRTDIVGTANASERADWRTREAQG